MSRNVLVLCIIPVVLLACRGEMPKGQAAPASAPSAATAVPGEPGQGPAGLPQPEGDVVSIGGKGVLSTTALTALLSKLEYRHMAIMQDAETTVRKVVDDYLARMLAQKEARALGLEKEKPLSIQIQTVYESWLGTYQRMRLLDNVASPPSRDESGKGTPRKWEKRSFAEVTVAERGEAESLRKRVLSGEDIGELARKHSVSPSAEGGGLLGDFFPDETPDLPRLVVLDLWEIGKGQCAEVFPSPLGYGYGFACVQDIRPLNEEEKKGYAGQLQAAAKQERVEAFRKALEKGFSISIAGAALDNLDTLPGDYVLGSACGREITKDYFQNYFPPRPKLTYPKAPGGKKQYLEAIARDLCYYDLAIKAGLQNDRDFQAKYGEYLSGVVTDKYFRKLYGSLRVPDDKVREVYDANREKIREEGFVQARVIVLDDEKKAWDLDSKLRQGDVWFEEAVREYSTDPATKKKRGDIGSIPVKGPVPEAYKPVLELKKGKVSPPFPYKGKYYIFRVDERTEGRQLAFEEAREQIRNVMLKAEKEKAYQAELERLKAKYKVKVDQELIKSVSSRLAAHGKGGHGN